MSEAAITRRAARPFPRIPSRTTAIVRGERLAVLLSLHLGAGNSQLRTPELHMSNESYEVIIAGAGMGGLINNV